MGEPDQPGQQPRTLLRRNILERMARHPRHDALHGARGAGQLRRRQEHCEPEAPVTGHEVGAADFLEQQPAELGEVAFGCRRAQPKAERRERVDLEDREAERPAVAPPPLQLLPEPALERLGSAAAGERVGGRGRRQAGGPRAPILPLDQHRRRVRQLLDQRHVLGAERRRAATGSQHDHRPHRAVGDHRDRRGALDLVHLGQVGPPREMGKKERVAQHLRGVDRAPRDGRFHRFGVTEEVHRAVAEHRVLVQGDQPGVAPVGRGRQADAVRHPERLTQPAHQLFQHLLRPLRRRHLFDGEEEPRLQRSRSGRPPELVPAPEPGFEPSAELGQIDRRGQRVGGSQRQRSSHPVPRIRGEQHDDRHAGPGVACEGGQRPLQVAPRVAYRDQRQVRRRRGPALHSLRQHEPRPDQRGPEPFRPSGRVTEKEYPLPHRAPLEF